MREKALKLAIFNSDIFGFFGGGRFSRGRKLFQLADLATVTFG